MVTDENYPAELLRGIANSNEQFVTVEGYPRAGAFEFDEYDPNSRDDGFRELSINWLDDEGAIDVLLNQINTRKNTPQFQGGYCRFSRLNLAIIFSSQIEGGYLSYERRPIEEDREKGIRANKYHGNILLKNEVSRPMRTDIQAALATLAGLVIKRDERQNNN